MVAARPVRLAISEPEKWKAVKCSKSDLVIGRAFWLRVTTKPLGAWRHEMTLLEKESGRRTFLKGAALAGAGLIIGFRFDPPGIHIHAGAAEAASEFAPNAQRRPRSPLASKAKAPVKDRE